MKTRNIYGGLVMTAAALLCLAGCKKDEEGEKIMLGTQFEKAVSAQKTYLGENNTVCWSEGDEVTVNTETVTVSDGSVNVTKAEHYYAVYPAEGNSVDATGGEVTIPAVQEYKGQVLNGPMAARLDEASGMLYFKNLYSLLKVTVCADEKAFTVNSITVTGTGSLAGTYSFGFNGATTTEASTAPTVGEITSGSNKVTLNCSSVEVAANTDKDFYLVVHPLTTAQKLTVKVNGVLDNKMVVYTYNTLSARTLNRSRIGGLGINLQQLNPELGSIGEFTVNASGDKVSFSPGNLQYNLNSDKWRFAPNQWDILETNGMSIGENYATYKTNNTNDGWMGLFGWSTSATNYGISTSIDNANYSGDFVDWGKNIGDGSTWRTLTKDEWVYLIQTRDNASNLYKKGVTVCEKSNCLIIAPDGFTGTIKDSYDDESAWSAAEAAGLVCLPAAGFRDGTSVHYSAEGDYWSSTYEDSDCAYDLFFSSGYVKPSRSGLRYEGQSVRLVKDVK